MTCGIVGPGDLVREQLAELAETIVRRQFAAHPDLARRDGHAGRERYLEDAAGHLGSLADAMNAGDPALFTDHVGWAKVMLSRRGVPVDDLARCLDFTRTVVDERLDGAAGALASEYVSAGLARLPSLPTDLAPCLGDDAPHADLARAFLRALLSGERHLASRMVLDAVASGVAVKDLYLHVFQTALYEVGRRWQLNDISVAQEHYCTAATQLIMSQLYPQIFASRKRAGTLVGACVAGDLHEIGMRMVTDFFEMEGWNTFYLGANMPSQGVVDTVVQRHAQVLGISATMSGHLRAVEDLIQNVRADPRAQAVKILVGGYPFLRSPDLWRRMGADGSAANAQDAIRLGNRWLRHDPQ